MPRKANQITKRRIKCFHPNYKIEYVYKEEGKRIDKYYFTIVLLDDEEEKFHFYTYRQAGGFGVDYSYSPEEYLLFGAILLIEKEKIREMVEAIKK